MNKPLWTPTTSAIKNSRMYHFIQYINREHNLTITEYKGLYDWSIEEKALFWQSIWQYFDIANSKKPTKILNNPNDMLQANWFQGGLFNFAENLLKKRNGDIALIAIKEDNTRREISCQELYNKVASLQKSFIKSGVKKGSCVAGLMPNCIETIVGMLATTSLGAIWSSCSPDFGAQGVIDRFAQINPTVLMTVDGYLYNGKPIDISDKVSAVKAGIKHINDIVIVPFLSDTPNEKALKNGMSYENYLIPSETVTFEQLPFDHPVYIMFSSGTTGVPKCIVHGAGGTLLQHLKELALHTNLSHKDCLLFFTTCGWMMWNWFVSSLALGTTCVLYDGSPSYPDFNRLLDIIDNEKVTCFGTSAKFISALEKENIEPNTTHELTTLHTILSTGSPLSPQSFDYVYNNIKKDCLLSSISGGTDIISCFALGNPILPVYRGELQCIGLGMHVEIVNDQGKSIRNQKGELVCLSPFPSQPVSFWNDKQQEKYINAYFSRFKNIWAHGDYACITKNNGLIIYGRSDAILNPGGVRIGTAEIYRQVDKIPEIIDSVVIAQPYAGDVRVILFVMLKDKEILTDKLINTIKLTIRTNASPRHVPHVILSVPDIPRTISGKTAELAVKKTVMGESIQNLDALANPGCLEAFKRREELE